ncbi:MAG: SIMPL domain-containing protein [Pseudomonadota bacterium]
MRGLVVALIGLAFVATPALAEDRTATMTFSGTGNVTVVPDEATVSLGVVTQARTAAQALADNTPAVERLIALLREVGVADEDLATERFDVSPVYGRQVDNARQITGYQVSNSLRVRIVKLADLGPVLDKAVNAGATSVGAIQMRYSDREGALDEARVLALGEAKRKAALMAEAAGLALGDILSIQEGGAIGPRPLQRSFALAEASAVPIEPGSATISAMVSVVWEIEPLE